MAGAIRNHCVARGSLAAGTTTTVYTVPAGYVFLFKSIFVGLNSSAGGAMWAQAYDPVGGSGTILTQPTLAAYGLANWQGWLALNSGDQLNVYTAAGPLNYWVSGALLPYVPGL